jgi:hypothetical protein
VVNGAFSGSGGTSEVPWASVFDPDINLKAVGAVQQRGFRAATEVVNRLVRMTAQMTDGVAAEVEPNESACEDAQLGQTVDEAGPAPDVDSRVDADRVLQSWQNLMGQFVGSIRGTVTQAVEDPLFDLAKAESRGQISLESTSPGPVCAEVWLHNRGADDLGKVRLRCSDLLAHDGALVAASVVRFEPDAVPMPPRSSRGVTVEVDVNEDIRPGSYRGTLLAEGHEEVWMPVVLAVRPGTA